MSTDLFNATLFDLPEAFDDLWGVGSSFVSRKCPVFSSETGRILTWASRLADFPPIIGTIIIDLDRRSEIENRSAYGRGLQFSSLDIGSGDIVATSRIVTYDEQAGTPRRGSKFGSIQYQGTEYIVIAGKEVQRLSQDRLGVHISKPFDVLHHEKRWFQFGYQSKEMPE